MTVSTLWITCCRVLAIALLINTLFFTEWVLQALLVEQSQPLNGYLVLGKYFSTLMPSIVLWFLPALFLKYLFPDVLSVKIEALRQPIISTALFVTGIYLFTTVLLQLLGILITINSIIPNGGLTIVMFKHILNIVIAIILISLSKRFISTNAIGATKEGS